MEMYFIRGLQNQIAASSSLKSLVLLRTNQNPNSCDFNEVSSLGSERLISFCPSSNLVHVQKCLGKEHCSDVHQKENLRSVCCTDSQQEFLECVPPLPAK